MSKTIYRFGPDQTDGTPEQKDLLGGKGAYLAWMASMDLPVPPGFTIPTSVCKLYEKHPDVVLNAIVEEELPRELKVLSAPVGYQPLLSVRSGAPVSMPGMMDTILNVGLTSDTMDEWCERLGDRTAYDCLRRLQMMLGTVAYEMDADLFEQRLERLKAKNEVEQDSDLTAEMLSDLTNQYFEIWDAYDKAWPDTVEDQLRLAIKAVFDSWNCPRAIEYRNQNGLSHDMGTAVNVQTMVFGNMNDRSATGVMFTRNPQTGENMVMGEYLVNAQGEDVVAGIRTPDPLLNMMHLDDDWAVVHAEIIALAELLENAAGDAQDVEFTVQNGKLFVLQTRAAKRSARAAVKIAWDLYADGKLSLDRVLQRITPEQFMKADQPVVDTEKATDPLLHGLPVCDGVAIGRVALSSKEAVEMAKDGPVILVGKETTPDDIAGMAAAVGILTQTGGATSHAAVVARGMDTVCVVGAEDLPTLELKSGQIITIDGSTGAVYADAQEVIGGTGLPEGHKILAAVAEREGVLVRSSDVLPGRRVMLADMMARGEDPKDVVEVYQAKDCSGALLDLTPPDALVSSEDTALLHCTGLIRYDDQVLGWLQALLATPLEGASLVLPSNVSAELRDQVVKAGYKVVERVGTLDQVIGSKGLVEADPALMAAVGSASAWKVVMSALAKDGVDVVEVPPSMSAGELVFKMLGKEN